MKEHNKNFYSLEELKRTRDSLEGYLDNEEVYYFVGTLRYACDEIERLNNEIKTLLKENGNKEKVIKAQDNIIKEVRAKLYDLNYKVKEIHNVPFDISEIFEMIEILDKEE